MDKAILILSILTIIAYGCAQRANKQENIGCVEQSEIDDLKIAETDQIMIPEFKELILDFGFKVTVELIEEFVPDMELYLNFKLERGNSIVYSDTSSLEYEFNDNNFPIVMQTGDNCFELLFEVNDRPNKNYLKRLFINNEKLVGQDRLPIFEANPIDINNDGIKEYAGYWDYSQIWGANDDLTAYNPILYYSVTKTGLKLDSLLTKERNEMVYGQFYGFSFSEKYEQPISVFKKFEQELKLIRDGR
ncbi:hypothetical protein LJB85_01715 [Porphyromonadaceae bacterium OttesenSCG-928-L07]|nr:hypothetical protein [Porphyromonadaceae bacterium OttesenSCG-928-L07]MDL2251237.1 hypothetical protein [Odoribacter sp. OttesenSCG-928-J03]